MELAVKAFFWVFIGGTLGLLLAATQIVWHGYALSVLWGWFMVPAFHLPVLSVPMAIGVAMVLGGMTGKKRSYDEVKDPTKKKGAFFFPFVAPGFALALGWIVKQFI